MHNPFLRLSLIAACAVVGSLTASAAIPEPIRIDAGQVTGIAGRDSAVRVFKGIPYAAPPVGELRWKGPQPPAKWDGVKAAETFGNNCTTGAGGPGGGGAGRGQGKGGGAKGAPDQAKANQAKAQAKGPAGPAASEDCLYINVWTTANAATEKRPVFIWTYGGGFTGGSGSEARYDGESLAKKGVVVVTYNYRLGLFGFLAHPDLEAETPHHTSGNYAIQDFQAALRWVQKNIAAFGGDPKKVTIGGESAGAIMVGAMVASPEFKGLFVRAIAQSGAWMGLSPAAMRTKADATAAGKTAVGSHTLAELRAMSTQEAAQAVRVQAGMVIDGWMIPEDASITFANGKQNKVDVLVGSNRDEGTFFGSGSVTSAQAMSRATQTYGDLAGELLKLYPAGTDAEASASGLARSRDEVGWHARTFAKSQVKQGEKAYVYYFTHVPPGGEARGATHTVELPYMFGAPAANANWTDTDTKLSDTMTSYWANFIATGNPNGAGLAKWDAYNAKNNDGKAMVFGDTAAFGPQIDTARLGFLDKYYATIEAKLGIVAKK